MRPVVVVATRNEDKLRELLAVLADAAYDLVPLDAAAPGLAEVEETGTTFAENARRKAVAASRATGRVAVGEDSGLVVDALDGFPGVRSARIPGAAGAAARNAAVLDRLQGVPDARRTARMVSAIAIATPDGRTWVVEGECPGRIAREPRGAGGFGYDPIFFVPALGKTLGECTPAEKHAVSHRGRAAGPARRLLRAIVAGR